MSEISHKNVLSVRAAILAKILLIAASVAALCVIAGCSSDFIGPYDMANLYFTYSHVSDSDGEYMIITGHTVSQTDVTIPDTIYGIPVKEVGESVFAGEEKLASVTFGKNVTKIGANAFGGCTSLETVNWNVSMSDIGDYAFQNCHSLVSVAIPENVTSIGRGAFYDCRWLKEPGIPATVSSIGGRAFSRTAWLDTTRAADEFVTVGDGILIAYHGNQANVTVPQNVKQIAGAFAGNLGVEKVTLPSHIQSIGDMAFMGCTKLEEVTVPDSVTEIGADAFCGCTSLHALHLGSQIAAVGDKAFEHCGAALYVREGSAAEEYCKKNGIGYTIA